MKAFLKAALLWFSCAIALAVAMAIVPALIVYRTAHLHLALLGFVTQMLYGVALHVIPRFFGQPLLYPRLAGVQFWTAQSGLVGLVTGFVLRTLGVGVAPVFLSAGALLSATGAACFVVNIWRTMDASPMQTINAHGRALPLMPQADAH
ncbi:MAG: hypothetical protein OEW77_07885 [Gemmatimonadota bacterium]|nr:hypothetical protein [Gemmatimonadota bacterium]